MPWATCSSMKKKTADTKEKEIKKEAKNQTKGREIEVFRGLSSALRSFRHRVTQSIRLSLTLKISAHYCGELAKSFLFLQPLILLVLCLLIYPRFHAARVRILETPVPPGTEYTREIIQDTDVSAYVSDEEYPGGFFPRMGYVISHFFGRGHGFSICIPGIQTQGGRHTVFIYHRLSPVLYRYLILTAAFYLADLFRMMYFLRHHNRLDPTVVKPIREIAEMADKVSANNLSNRINVAGTKNELQDLAAVINSMLDRLEVSYESQKQFVSDASHELRTPISVIQGYADMLRRWGKEDPQVLEESINAISDEAASMKDLVENLLFLARHDKKTLMMEMSEFDPAELLQEIRKEAAMVSPMDTFVLSPAEHMTIQADRNMIKQVVRILLDNAVKYTPSGGTVTMGIHREGDCAVLTMQDTGIGIAPEDLPHIFDRFYRADKARKSETGGHGLGLSIARIIVVAHGGRIRVRSKVGEGTVFTVEIPLTIRESGEMELKADLPVRPRRFRLSRRNLRGRKGRRA